MKVLIVLCAVVGASLAQYGGSYPGYYAPPPTLTSHGVPVDTPEVQAARSSHLAALARADAAAAANPPSYNQGQYNSGAYNPAPSYNPAPYSSGGYAPAPSGPPQPVGDTPEVAAARAAHNAVHAAATAYAAAHPSQPDQYNSGAYNNHNHGGYSAPQQNYQRYTGPLAPPPTLTQDGVPVYTPEVQAARAAAAAAHQRVLG